MKSVVSLVIPCYNEYESIPILYEALIDTYNKLENEYDFEYIFVDDGSKDKTLDLLVELSSKDPKVKYLSFSRNFGKEAAMYAGFMHAKGDFITIMDADMQDPPSLLPEMLQILKDPKYDSVATKRVTRKGEPIIRSFFARRFYKVMNGLTDFNVEPGARDFRLMRRKMVDVIISMSESQRFSKGIFGWIGFNTYWLSYDNVERSAGKTKWNFFKLLKYSIEGITDFSKKPLYLSLFLSIISFLVSLGLFITSICYKVLYGYSLQTFMNLCALILFALSIILFNIAILGLYLGKVHREVKERPHYIVNNSNIDDLKRVG